MFPVVAVEMLMTVLFIVAMDVYVRPVSISPTKTPDKIHQTKSDKQPCGNVTTH